MSPPFRALPPEDQRPEAPPSRPGRMMPQDAPALLTTRAAASILTPDGELVSVVVRDAGAFLATLPPPLLVHGPATLRRLGLAPDAQPVPWFDLLELFLFVMPTRPVVPTPRGMALALGLSPPAVIEADYLVHLLETLHRQLQERAARAGTGAMLGLLPLLSRAGWAWAPFVESVLEAVPSRNRHPYEALRVWRRLPRWEETAQRPPPGSRPVSPAEARTRLAGILGQDAEIRPGQADYASAVSHALAPREGAGIPEIVLAEAGTGTGKTLGYIAPASLWAEQNDGPVWISTYTRHLQRQIEQELHRLYPDARERRETVVLRKGRENYLCLLNMEDAVNTLASRPSPSPSALIGLSMLARWAEETEDGDLMGGDLPGWFGDIFGTSIAYGMADRRGECIHGACPHYQSCYVEHSIRRARQARLVIANHALVLSQASWTSLGRDEIPEEEQLPTRYFFDEGHHLPEAADSAFSLSLSGLEAAELRRWLLGAEGSRSRARGLRRRLEDLVATMPTLEAPLDAILNAAHALPAPGWLGRLHGGDDAPQASVPDLIVNPSESFFLALRTHLEARRTTHDRGTARIDQSECDLRPVSDALIAATQPFDTALRRLLTPLETLVERLKALLSDPDDALEAAQRLRIEAMIRALRRRAIVRVQGWIAMLDTVLDDTESGQGDAFIDIVRSEYVPGRAGETDVGLHRHWRDPTIPFASVMQGPAHGLLITSATLRDQTPAPAPGATLGATPGAGSESGAEASWIAAETRLGTQHFIKPPLRASLLSPFDYARQTRALIVTDVPQNDPDALASAYRLLFMAAQGGALGLFTAISRLRAVHERIAAPLEEAGIPLYAQHVDMMDNASLVDVFRTELHSCLLGTDAMRDGVDVPGQALRLVVFERTPWPRPDILHRERRRSLSPDDPRDYDDRLTRMRLRQAFGRLVRKADDRGVFVILDRRMPSRLLSAFPDGVAVERVSLSEAVTRIGSFLETPPSDPATGESA
ncbi:ATP-dependent DNA helicase [Swaminathania salitolerans]|uniref:DNA helicase n=1 Tax=Swaminathania salitolerans TaxID=182838 RepID=A0A511BMH1_9PROT|nr:DNA helicase C2 [Swaminathania salitolerans LMG 21291]GEL01530.1 DNA helicase [Swaminathania salitolerans]